MRSIRLLLADDHPVFCAGLRTHMNSLPDVHVVGEAHDGIEAVRMALEHRPDVMLLDMEMPGLSGLRVAQRLSIEAPQIAVIILTAYADEDYVYGALQHGAAGFLIKEEPLSSIVEAVRGAARGETGWLSRRVAALPRSPSKGRFSLYHTLSDREREVARLIALGHSNEEIGEMVNITESTVKKHANNVYSKLGLINRAQCVAWMWKHGHVSPQDARNL